MNDFEVSKGEAAVRQFLRYAIIGMLSNISGYLIYLLATYMGATPKLTMTALYVVGAVVGFFGNRKFTFGYGGRVLAAGVRFIFAHSLGYLLNLSMLLIFVDHLGGAHQLVQALAIFVVAIFLFVMFRFFVFPEKAASGFGVIK